MSTGPIRLRARTESACAEKSRPGKEHRGCQRVARRDAQGEVGGAGDAVHLVDDEAEAHEVEGSQERRSVGAVDSPRLRADGQDDAPNEEVEDVPDASGEPRCALEDEGDGGHPEGTRSAEHQEVGDEGEGLEGPLASDHLHRHGRAHEPDGHGAQDGEVAEELAQEVLPVAHGARRHHGSNACPSIAVEGIAHQIEAEKREREGKEGRRGEGEGR